jgi:hypothetical protein
MDKCTKNEYLLKRILSIAKHELSHKNLERKRQNQRRLKKSSVSKKELHGSKI